MLRPILTYGLILLLVVASVYAQAQVEEEPETLDLVDLQVPDSPAFTLLGVSPASITRPTTPKDFGLSLLPLTSNNVGDMAIEYSPYWASNKRKREPITFTEYQNQSRKKAAYRSLSISLATTDFETDVTGMLENRTRAALGIRMNLLGGKPSPEYWLKEKGRDGVPGAKMELLYKAFEKGVDFSSEIQGAVNNVRDLVLKMNPDIKIENRINHNVDIKFNTYAKRIDDPNITPKEKLARVDAVEKEVNNEYDTANIPEVAARWDAVRDLLAIKTMNQSEKEALRTDLQKLAQKRYGWQIQIAGAVAYDLEQDDVSDEEFSRAGAWLTAAYTPKEFDSLASQFTVLGVTRYIFDETDGSKSKFDVGSRIIYEQKNMPLRFSGEFLRRFGDVTEKRLVALVEYEFTDNYSMYASYGKTFDDDFIGQDDLVAILGVNIGFGQSGFLKPKS